MEMLLEGKMTQEDMRELKVVLEMERGWGNRYVVVPVEKDPLRNGDLSYHRSAMDAWKHIMDKPIEEGIHIFRSVILLQDELAVALDGKREWELEQRDEIAHTAREKYGVQALKEGEQHQQQGDPEEKKTKQREDGEQVKADAEKKRRRGLDLSR